MCSSKRSVVPQSTASAGFALRVVAFLVAVHFGAHVRAQQQIAATDAAAPERWSQSHTSLLHGLFDSIANPHAEAADKCARDVGLIVDGVRNGETWALKSMIQSVFVCVCGVFYCIATDKPICADAAKQFWTLDRMCPARSCTVTISGSRPPHSVSAPTIRCP